MGRIRTFKPSFFRHEELQDMGAISMLVFLGLFTQADREGRFTWKPRHLKLDILPFLEFDMADVLERLEKHDFIRKYEVNGVAYGFIPTWNRHQVINNKELASALPVPDDACLTRASRVPDASDTSLKPSEGEYGREVEVEVEVERDEKTLVAVTSIPSKKREIISEEVFEAIYRAYPRKVGRGEALKAIRSAIGRLVAGSLAMPAMEISAAGEFLLEKSRRYAMSPAGAAPTTGEDYRPYPATWFNGERYFDAAEELQKSSGASNAKPTSAQIKFDSVVVSSAAAMARISRLCGGYEGNSSVIDGESLQLSSGEVQRERREANGTS